MMTQIFEVNTVGVIIFRSEWHGWLGVVYAGFLDISQLEAVTLECMTKIKDLIRSVYRLVAPE